MKVVIDTSSFFYGFQPEGGNQYITTPSVLNEIRGKRMRRSVEMQTELLQVLEPGVHSVAEVTKNANFTGDIGQLSMTDIELIALALEEGAELLTNDLAIQNVCARMGIVYRSFGVKLIDTEIEWSYRCIGCKRIYDRKLESCPHCGSELRKFPKKRKATGESTSLHRR